MRFERHLNNEITELSIATMPSDAKLPIGIDPNLDPPIDSEF